MNFSMIRGRLNPMMSVTVRGILNDLDRQLKTNKPPTLVEHYKYLQLLASAHRANAMTIVSCKEALKALGSMLGDPPRPYAKMMEDKIQLQRYQIVVDDEQIAKRRQHYGAAITILSRNLKVQERELALVKEQEEALLERKGDPKVLLELAAQRETIENTITTISRNLNHHTRDFKKVENLAEASEMERRRMNEAILRFVKTPDPSSVSRDRLHDPGVQHTLSDMARTSLSSMSQRSSAKPGSGGPRKG